MNTLYYGDNLEILRRYIKDESVDLAYLDPPFKSDQNYNVLFAERDGSRSAAQIKAFEDTWRWDEAAARAYREVVESGGPASQAMQAFRMFPGESDMLAYLAMMAPRLVELRRVLKRTGTVYLHCDPTASHYLKLLMDGVFGASQFRNEIVWVYRGGGMPRRDFGRRHDVILRYSKTDRYVFYPDSIRVPYQAEGIGRTDDAMWGKHRGIEKVYKPHPLGKIPEDWWPMNVLNANDPERLGYPTQKPEALLERIIKASSKEGDVVIDPFCGCGTTIAVAQKLNREWIGIDITHLAITLIRHRLKDQFGDAVEYRVIGEPVSLPDAESLAQQDPYQFQWWALGLVGARPTDQRRGSDRGIDGRLYFHDEPKTTRQVLISVKCGHVSVSDVRDLRGVLERENADIGALLTLREPTQPMRAEAASAGFYQAPWGAKVPRIQILTIADLLGGGSIQYPRENVTFKKAPKVRPEPEKPGSLLF
jgi:site-specific DNA-methyltransferase (adenine-specific)